MDRKLLEVQGCDLCEFDFLYGFQMFYRVFTPFLSHFEPFDTFLRAWLNPLKP